MTCVNGLRMIKIRYRDPNELSPGLHAAAERHGRSTMVYLLHPGRGSGRQFRGGTTLTGGAVPTPTPGGDPTNAAPAASSSSAAASAASATTSKPSPTPTASKSGLCVNVGSLGLCV